MAMFVESQSFISLPSFMFVSAVVSEIRELKEKKKEEKLTLGAHAQRGLQYLVCVSVCVSVCYHVFCHRAQQCAQENIPAASAGHEQSLKNGVFFKNVSFRSYGDICLRG